MNFNHKLNNYIELILSIGLNLKSGDKLYININAHLEEFATLVMKRAYQKGASDVIVNFKSDSLDRVKYDLASEHTLKTVHDFQIAKDALLADEYYKVLSVASPDPYIMQGVDSQKVKIAMSAYLKACNKLKKNTASNVNSWCVIAVANQKWADFATDGNIDKLWDMIFTATRSDIENPNLSWEKHITTLNKVATYLNNNQFDYIHFENKLGTNLKVQLVNNHIWAAADDCNTRTGERFIANIPTEEVFTMPSKYGTSGIVYSTKPLNYNGQLIDQFSIEFIDGKVVNYDAKKGQEALKSLIEFDLGASYLGEVALVSKNSPINQMNQLFYNTLFDENSSCHLALGNAYPINIEGGINMNDQEKEANGVNVSDTHVDFMFGSDDMKITAAKEGQYVIIFENGDFTI